MRIKTTKLKQIKSQIKICSVVKLFDYLCLHQLGAVDNTTASVTTTSRNLLAANRCLHHPKTHNKKQKKKIQNKPTVPTINESECWSKLLAKKRKKTHEFAMKICPSAIAAKLLVCNANTYVFKYIYSCIYVLCLCV